MRRPLVLLMFGLALLTLVFSTACSPTPPAAVGPGSPAAAKGVQPLTISAIPDQDPEKLQRLYGKVADYLQKELGVPVVYRPVTDNTAAVTAFKVGDLDLVWYGGLTGVQARLQVPNAEVVAQRDIDAEFHTVFIANQASGLAPVQAIQGLQSLKGKTFTFGADTSTSGRLMPQYYLKQAGVALTDFKGEVGFSGSHDKTIKLVESGTYDAGALNEQVWQSRVDSKEVDLSKVQLIWRTPAYFDYHWVINPQVKQRYGADFPQKVQAAFLKLDASVADQKEILDLFGARKFIPSQKSNYDQIEAVGRDIGKIQ